MSAPAATTAPIAPAATAAPAPAPVKQRLLDKNFAVASFVFNRWSAVLEEGQGIEDALDPSFWASQSGKIMGHDKAKGRGDIIEVRKLSTGLYAELLVTEVGAGWIKVEKLRMYEPEAIAIPDRSALTTRWNDGKKCHEVVRKADGYIMSGGFQSKQTAAKWIDDHTKALAA